MPTAAKKIVVNGKSMTRAQWLEHKNQQYQGQGLGIVQTATALRDITVMVTQGTLDCCHIAKDAILEQRADKLFK